MRTRTTVAALTAGLFLVGGGTALALAPGDAAIAPVALSSVTGAPPAGAAAPAVDRAAAERIALERAGGGQVTEVEFDRADDDRDDADDRDDRDDRDHWEVEVRDGGTEHDIDVDAVTGEILDHDVDGHTDDD